jgi:hypothetical protein
LFISTGACPHPYPPDRDKPPTTLLQSMKRSLVPDAIERYVAEEITHETAVQRRLRAETAPLPNSGMQIGSDQGALHAMLAKLLDARRAIEIGTYTGYSALAVAQALPSDGKLICCDVSEEWTSLARRYWQEAGVAGRIELRLAPATDTLAALLRQASAIRRAHGEHTHPLWRMTPERWLESRVLKDIRAIDDRLDPTCVYSQVPAFAASDRAMIDVLSITIDGRLAILELKADEDMHLPLQGIDYWARVEWHRARGEFERFGYFAGRPLAAQAPILLLVAPALRVHPTTDTLLRYIAPEIDVTLVGIDERWREELRVIFRKRRP